MTSNNGNPPMTPVSPLDGDVVLNTGYGERLVSPIVASPPASRPETSRPQTTGSQITPDCGACCCNPTVERIMKWRWWRLIVMKLPYPMAFILSIGCLLVGNTGPIFGYWFMTWGGNLVGAHGYCQGTECVTDIVYSLDTTRTSLAFANTSWFSMILLVIGFGGSIATLFFIYLTIRFFMLICGQQTKDLESGVDQTSIQKEEYKNLFARVMSYTAIWTVIMGLILAIWLFTSEDDGEGEIGKSIWYFVLFTAILWPFVGIFYTHREAEAREHLRRARRRGKKVMEKSTELGQKAKEKTRPIAREAKTQVDGLKEKSKKRRANKI